MIFVSCNDTNVLGVNPFPFKTDTDATRYIPEWAIKAAQTVSKPPNAVRIAVYKSFEDGSDLLTVVQTRGNDLLEGVRFLNGGAVTCKASLGTTLLRRWLKLTDLPKECHSLILQSVKNAS